MLKCIPNKFYETRLFSYSEYIKSHNWEIKINQSETGRGQTWVCKECNEIRIMPSGTIDFSFGCSIIPVCK